MRPLHYLPDSGFWKKKKVLVTGGSGFVGRAVCDRLAYYGAEVIIPRKAQFDFTRLERVEECISMHRPDIVIHAAAYYGGLGITMEEPGKIFYENLVMGAHLMEVSRRNSVSKFVTIGTNCGYPGYLGKNMNEEDFWAGPIHETVMAYGAAKKMLHAQGLAYRKQYGFQAIYLIPTNLYGPHDHFEDYRSHVAAALVKKFVEAQETQSNVTLWGTGAAIREFLYVDDAADGILLATEKYGDSTPLNIGPGVGTSIRELAETVAQILDFRHKIVWDRSKPDGQPFKTLDISRMQKTLQWEPRVHLEEGLRRTLQWYLENRASSIGVSRPLKVAA